MKIEEILYQMEEKCAMNISAPTRSDDLNRLESLFPEQVKHLRGLYAVTDGVEINVPGTVLYSADEVMKRNERRNSMDLVEVGTFNFGDRLYLAADGTVTQIDHETGEFFFEWNSLNRFLMDELSAL